MSIDIDRQLILPDSRTKEAKNLVTINGEYWVPIFCANCGCDGGLVPEKNMTFVFWLCNPCFETHGAITNLHAMPEEVFWEKVKLEQLESHGRLLGIEELIEIVAADASPLATLIKEGR